MITTDNKTYYKRTGDKKAKIVCDYVENLENVSIVFDVGCNNGNISYPLQKKLGKSVYGIDLADDLILPKDYNFEQKDILTDNQIILNDVTIFFSLYHHILGAHGLETADKLFLKLLLRTKYLIFDTGNLSEVNRKKTYWAKEQIKHFKNEKELLDHFGVPYEIIGLWNCGGGSRSVCVFRNDESVCMNVTETYGRLTSSKYIKKGLVPQKEFGKKKISPYVSFAKLEWNGVNLFSKYNKPSHPTGNEEELQNIVDVYNTVPPERLIEFYGYSENYGLIYEWLDDFEFVRSGVRLKINKNKTLVDVEKIKVNGEEKLIDFER